ncbi:unnamed protein product [Caenorhabditis brenneri]
MNVFLFSSTFHAAPLRNRHLSLYLYTTLPGPQTFFRKFLFCPHFAMEFNMMETAQQFLQMFNLATEHELIRIQHLQNHPIASSVVHLDHSDSSSAFKEYHPYLNRLQRQANNIKALIDSMAQPPFLQFHSPMIPPILATDFSTSPFFQQLQLHQGPVGTPIMVEDDMESKKAIKNHRRNRLRLKKQILQADKLTPGTAKFDEKFKEAKEYYESCEVYKDERIKILKNYLFDPSKTIEMPQKVDIVNISTRTIYNHWTKQNGLGRRANPSWASIERSNYFLCQEWKEIATKIDGEQENQLRLGYIYGDIEQAHGADDNSDNN